MIMVLTSQLRATYRNSLSMLIYQYVEYTIDCEFTHPIMVSKMVTKEYHTSRGLNGQAIFSTIIMKFVIHHLKNKKTHKVMVSHR